MHLLIDIGNSTVVGAIANDNGEIVSTWRFDTIKNQTTDYYIDNLKSGLCACGIEPNDIEKTAISSVVPELNNRFVDAVSKITGGEPRFFSVIDAERLMDIDVDFPEQVGKDRLADAIAAAECYGSPTIVIDMGTATTVGIVTAQRKFVGGMIIPGVKTSHRALCERASQLSEIDKWEAKSIVGRNTKECMQSGVIFGAACMIDGVIDRINDMFDSPFTIVATGGMSSVIVPYCKHEIIVDKHLLLKGIYHAVIAVNK